ncbi:MAG TPA: CoA ester lyase [Rhizomicrobium sp.]|nr:CoA ester lyase [Rhizomicrobium sp.]
MMRSKLFVPASRPELFAKAEASAADSLSFDLEDSVVETRKDEARGILADYLKSRTANGKAIVVRINAANTGYFDADVEAMVAAGVEILNQPMVRDLEDLAKLENRIAQYERHPGRVKILANIETPQSLRRAVALAVHPRVMGLQVGYADLLEPCGLDRRDEAVLSHIRLTVRFAAAEAGIPVYDGAFAGVSDPEFFERECAAARRHGFSGKSCIHPSQVAIANKAFAPTEAEIARAHKIIAAASHAKGAGAFLVDGQMIDKPFLLRAQEIVRLSEQRSEDRGA